MKETFLTFQPLILNRRYRMIRIIKGTYGLRRGNKVEAMTPGTEPFSLSAEREKELVEQGTA